VGLLYLLLRASKNESSAFIFFVLWIQANKIVDK